MAPSGGWGPKMHGLPTKEKIDEAKSAIDAWIKELEGSL